MLAVKLASDPSDDEKQIVLAYCSIRETTGCLASEFSSFDTLALGFESFVFF